MILTVDAGNTNVTLAVYEGSELKYSARIYTERRKTEDQYAYDFKQILTPAYSDPAAYEGAVISSVVPEITRKLAHAARFITGKQPVVLGVGVKTKLCIKGIHEGELGADLVAGAVGAKAKYPMPCLIWDLGTCTKISVLNEKGEFLGCSISPGIRMSVEALGANTSQLTQIGISDYAEPFGNTTFASISSGVIVGTAVMLEGLSQRIIEKLELANVTVVVTGGYARFIQPSLTREITYDANLVTDGLRAVFELNREACV
jgi:type III pantothenate kinase